MLKGYKRGFTIIEVVLVLAIAGLIFLMVFVALPALQAEQRDAQRRNDVGIIAAAVKNYMKNNSGNPPPDAGNDQGTQHTDNQGTWSTVSDSPSLRRYLVDLDPGGVTQVVSVRNLVEQNSTIYRYRIENTEKKFYEYVSVFVGAKCPDLNNQILEIHNTGIKGDICIIRYLERGYWYCQEV